jgi:lambda family phage minor tail protein L
MTIQADMQSLEPGGLIEVYEVNATTLGVGIFRFHGYPQIGSIWWQGLQYDPWPIQAEGFDRAASGKPPTPVLSLSNLNGSITALCLSYDDLVGSIFTRRRTLTKYLDAANFPGGNPTADPTQKFPDEIWFIERKTHETAEQASFELASAMDFNNVQLPRRQIIANQCPWRYRDANCGYTGGPVAKIDDTPTSNPALDDCGKKVTSCKKRFGENGVLNHGGFPAAGLVR